MSSNNNDIHFYNVEHAKKYGVVAAVILSNFVFWIKKNVANKQNYYDGQYWTYNSVKAFEVLFPEFTTSQIKTAIKKLEEHGVLKTGNYNVSSYDRTKWFTIVDCKLLGIENPLDRTKKSICEIPPMENHNLANGFDDNSQPIPDINTDKIPDINTDKDSILLFDIWKDQRCLIQHKTMNASMRKAIESRLKEYSYQELKECILNYSKVMFDNKTYYYKYPHNFDDFFRNGSIQKVAPYRNFLTESKPLEKFSRNDPKKQYQNNRNKNEFKQTITEIPTWRY